MTEDKITHVNEISSILHDHRFAEGTLVKCSKSVYFIEDDSIGNLVAAIRKFKDLSLRKMYKSKIRERYKKIASQRILNSNFEKIIFEN